MLRDVFYYGSKPNAHAREKYAIDLADARQQCTTEHFWIINEYSNYTNFEWDWDFDFLPDDEVWTGEHNNVWPNQYQKDSGTWLCSKQDSEIIIYRSDVEPVYRKNTKHNNWVILDKINELKFDFSWEPNPYDPPYIYKWGCKFYPAEIKHYVEYHVKDATDIKYMPEIVELSPEWNKWVEIQSVDKELFDFSWRPDPREPAYIYTWGNKYISAELQPTLEYHVEGAIERKYMDNNVALLPEWDKWVEVQAVDKKSFDFSWRPDPREPAFIYTWGNKYISSELQPTLEYHVEGATERKYMDNTVGVLPNWDNWVEVQAVDKKSFDFSWRPNPKEPAYIYTWGNKYISAELQPTLEYHCNGATERKYMDNSVDVLPEWDKWNIKYSIDKLSFNFSWRPDPREPAFIYVFGNTQYPAEIMSTVEYHVPGSTEYKFIEDDSMRAKLLPDSTRFEHLENSNGIDYSWYPDPWSPPYIYAWGNQWNKPEDKISIQFKVEGATEYKYMEERATRKPCMDNWQIPPYVIKNSFDFSWEPNPKEPAYIYQFGTIHQKTGGPRYIVPGATEVKYIDIIKAKVIAWKFTNWLIPRNLDQKAFDWSWHPDDTEPPYIYQFPNQWSKTGGPRFEVLGATEIKYIETQIAIAKPDMTHWSIPDGIDTTKFDFSWHPDKDHEPLIYQFGTQHQRTGGPIFTAVGCTEDSDIKYVNVTKAKALITTDNWVTHEDVVDFDYSWHPDSTEQPYIYQWGNKHYSSELQPTVEYIVPGATQIKHMSQDVRLKINDKWIEHYDIDKNKFDMTWRPDPTSPPYIYKWGNKHVPVELKATLEYVVDGATEVKYMTYLIEVLPEFDRWKEIQSIDRKQFDLTWRPDPREPEYIYVWGNKWIPGELKSTIEYHVPGATEYKYMDELVIVLPEHEYWIVTQDIVDFDMSWRPDPREPAYIYTWGNKYISAEIKPTLEYYCPGATERKYMDNIEVVPEYERWIVTQDIVDFDMSWRPDPREPDYIYVWGNKYISAEIKPTLEYYCPGATERKYMDNTVAVLPEYERWIVTQDIVDFDMSWRPDPREPAYIYTWGNKYISAEIKPTLEYYCEGATERKYMDNIEVVPEYERWIEYQPVDRTKFDMSWRPDPREPAYIYVWGNKWIAGELEPTIEYHVPGAVEKKYMQEPAEVLPISDRWKIIQNVENFDFSWRPDPREPDYIYVWGNKYIAGELQSTIEYHCVNGTERKYMGDVDVAPEWDKWNILIPIDKSSFDFSWRPDPREPAFIYTWGNKYINSELQPTLEYHVDGATERKYMHNDVVVSPEWNKWNTLIPIDKSSFDFTWRPDPREPAYIYTWGNKYISAQLQPTLEYYVDGATERKYMDNDVAVLPEWDKWNILIPVDKISFDFRWRPDPREPAYIYVWGNKYNEAEREPTIEYHCPGATEIKYMDDKVATTLPEMDKWTMLIPVESFDYSWRPDPKSPPYIYVFGNKWNDSATEPTLEYKVDGANEIKYIDDIVATPKPDLQYWKISNNDDLETFDFSWRPNPHSPPQIYQWADNGPRYTMPDATEVVLMEQTVEIRKTVVNRYKIKTTLEDLINEYQDEVFWAINPDLSYDKFNFSWRPNEENFRHVNVFGNEYSKNTQTYYVNAPLYLMGHKEYNYVEGQTVEIDSNLSMFYIDRGNSESTDRFNILKIRYPQIQKTRYLNGWVDTINRCITKSETKLFWVLNSEIDYSEFEFDFYPSPWQEQMVHVFGTQWSHWGTTFMVNKETFPEDTKYVKIIEHLSTLNFVKTKRAIASNCLYDVYLIDYNNDGVSDIVSLIESKTKQKNVHTIKYDTDYLTTFTNILYKLDDKKDHYIWVCSSICDYTNFDFTYICDPFSLKQLHVFPSDKQKFGDTFFINVNDLHIFIEGLAKLENIAKINFNQHQRVKRLPAPSFVTETDTHLNFKQHSYNFPYAVFTTSDNLIAPDLNDEPISMWSKESKNILITNTGGTRIVVPKEANDYVEKELYDYPYIAKATKMGQSKPLDIVFLSNGETSADENYEHLLNIAKRIRNRVVRVDGINGRVAAYHAAAMASSTPWMFTVFAKLKVDNKFDFSWQPDRLQIPKHYIFHATNPVNGLEYGHQAMIAYNKQITLGNIGKGLDFTLDSEHEVVELNSGVARYNTDAFSTWRTSFREAIKLRLDDSTISKHRLKIWSTVGEGDYAQYSINGALDAVEYFEQVNGELDKLRLSYDWPWLKKYFNTKYN